MDYVIEFGVVEFPFDFYDSLMRRKICLKCSPPSSLREGW